MKNGHLAKNHPFTESLNYSPSSVRLYVFLTNLMYAPLSLPFHSSLLDICLFSPSPHSLSIPTQLGNRLPYKLCFPYPYSPPNVFLMTLSYPWNVSFTTAYFIIICMFWIMKQWEIKSESIIIELNKIYFPFLLPFKLYKSIQIIGILWTWEIETAWTTTQNKTK